MGYYDDHINVVSKRWIGMREQSPLSPRKFNEKARKMLIGYGWTDQEVDRILNIKKGE